MTAYEDRYFYPGTQTLRNNFGITDPGDLKRAEARLTAGVFILPPEFDFKSEEGLKRAHKSVFGALYPWAGVFRAENMIKKEGADREDVRFLDGPLVAPAMKTFMSALQDDLRKGSFSNLGKEKFTYRAAVYVADLNHIHPFPDGNGRIQRLFLEKLAHESGFKLDHTKYDRDSWIDAAIDARHKSLYDQRGILSGLADNASLPRLIAASLDEQKSLGRDLSRNEDTIIDAMRERVDRGEQTVDRTDEERER